MSKRSGDALDQEAKSVSVCGRIPGAGTTVHSTDCSYAQLQCRKQGLKRRGSFSDVTAMSPVKVEDPSSESLAHKVSTTERSIRRPCLAIQELRHVSPTTPDVSCTQGQQRDKDGVDGSDDSLCRQALQAELHRRTEELLATQGQRDAAIAEMRVHMVHHSKQVRSIETELQAELWRTTEEIKVARKQRDDAIAGKQMQLERQCDQVYEIEMRLQMELQKARRDLLFVHQQRDDALKELDSQSKHQQEQVDQIEMELRGELQRTLEEIRVVRRQRDDAIAEKHVQLEQQCDVVYEIEMGLQMELRRLLSELESARKEHEAAVLEVHLQQEHQHEQVHQIERELQGMIQMKSEELKVVQKERDKAISDTHSQLELQCDQVTEVEMRLQRNLQHLLGELQSVQELPEVLDHHLDQAREIQEALLLSTEKLNCLKKQRRIAGEELKPTPQSKQSIREKQMKDKSLQTQKEALKVS